MRIRRIWAACCGLGMALQVSACSAPLLSAPVMTAARPTPTRAASVDGFKSRLQALILNEMAKHDRNNDKYLSAEEAKLPSLEFSRADKNSDKRLDLNELVAFYLRDLYSPFNQRALQLFKALDRDGSDSLKVDEFLKVALTATGPDGQPLQPSPLLYRMTDRNRNYTVEFDEFEDMLAWDAADLLPGAAPGPTVPPAIVPAPPAVIAAPPKEPAGPQAPGDPPHPAPDSLRRN